MKRSMFFALLLLVPSLALGAAPGDSTTSAPAAADSTAVPAPALGVAGAFDDARGVLVIFGGSRTGGAWSGETWEWNGAIWKLAATTGPSPRGGAALAYDPTRKQLLLFGGENAAGVLGDTWAWDGATWTMVAAGGPPPRALHQMTFDQRRGTIVLVGGANRGAAYAVPMEWNGKMWNAVEFSAPPRARHALAADPDLGVTVMFGGDDSLTAKGTGVARGDTWVMGPQGWRMATTPGPPARDQAAMASDVGRHLLVLYGGVAGGKPLADTWEREYSAWKKVDTKTSPGPRANPVLEYDSVRHVVLLFGGADQAGPKNDLWSWDGTNWVKIK